ncbi:MAG: ureidoglycolate lyase, partial [Pseudomonadota bacterium]
MDVVAEPLTAAAFARYGDVIEIGRSEPRLINDGRCRRYHDLARLDFDLGGRVGVSLFHSDAVDLPYTCRLMERHPLGSQAFLPMSEAPFLVIVADDDKGAPVEPRAFLSAPGQGVNYHRNIWHGVLTPLGTPQTFTV